MDSLFVLIIIFAVLSVVVRVIWWFFRIRAVISEAQQFQQQQMALMQLLQQAGQSGGMQASLHPKISNQLSQIQQTYGSLSQSDQMRYEESMASMKADAASYGCFLD